MFDLRRLRLLHELALRGTIAAVAQALDYSPSTVSQQLSRLEEEAGVALLEPEGRRLRLTAAGLVLAEHAGAALQLDEAARSRLAGLSDEPTMVAIAAIQTVAQNLVPPAISWLAAHAPWLVVTTSELPPETSLRELSARSFDLVVAEQYPGHTRQRRSDLVHLRLGPDPLRLVVEAGDSANSLADLADRVWVMEPEGTAVRQWAVQQCRAAGFEPVVRHSAADLGTHVRLIAAGHAVGMLPDLVWPQPMPEVRLLPLPAEPARELFAAVRKASAADPAITLVRHALAATLQQRGCAR